MLILSIKLIEDLPKVFRSVMKKYNLAPGDFPDIEDYRSKLAEQEFSKFSPLKQKLLDDVETVLSVDLPRLMEALPRSLNQEAAVEVSSGPLVYDDPRKVGGGYAGGDNPWGDEGGGDNPFDEDEWELQSFSDSIRSEFATTQVGGYVTGAAAKGVLASSGLPKATLRKIWDLADVDKDGQLDLYEYTIALYLIDMSKNGQTIPDKIPNGWIPAEKK
jgi:hypothetical protein